MGRGISKDLMTHCRREVLHAQWDILIDGEFLEAYEHGIVITCCDGITRRFYPRLMTYSADYPEKYMTCYLLRSRPLTKMNPESCLLVFVIMHDALVLGVLFLRHCSRTWAWFEICNSGRRSVAWMTNPKTALLPQLGKSSTKRIMPSTTTVWILY